MNNLVWRASTIFFVDKTQVISREREKNNLEAKRVYTSKSQRKHRLVNDITTLFIISHTLKSYKNDFSSIQQRR